MTLITLLTDFGLQDEYVGVMKGVIATMAPDAQVIDLTHGIDPQDVTQGAYLLAAAYPYFPAGSIHVAVVDPGVGGSRRMVAMACDSHFFVAPDNGILDRVLDQTRDQVLPATAVYLENQDCFLKPVSPTFHGRDIFAPVAARLAIGFPLENLGPGVDPALLQRSKTPRETVFRGPDLIGQVIHVDRFGNLLTTIDQEELFEHGFWGPDAASVRITLCDQSIEGIFSSYDAVPRHSLLAVVGSRGLLEISVNCGNAQEQLGAKKGTPVRVSPTE